MEFYSKSNVNVPLISHKYIILINTFQIDGMDGISANGALAYDAVQILDAAFKKILKDKPNPFKNDRQIGTNIHYLIVFMAFSLLCQMSFLIKVLQCVKKILGPITCNMTSEGKVQPWIHGATIARALKNVKIEGLTGSIR